MLFRSAHCVHAEPPPRAAYFTSMVAVLRWIDTSVITSHVDFQGSQAWYYSTANRTGALPCRWSWRPDGNATPPPRPLIDRAMGISKKTRCQPNEPWRRTALHHKRARGSVLRPDGHAFGQISKYPSTIAASAARRHPCRGSGPIQFCTLPLAAADLRPRQPWASAAGLPRRWEPAGPPWRLGRPPGGAPGRQARPGGHGSEDSPGSHKSGDRGDISHCGKTAKCYTGRCWSTKAGADRSGCGTVQACARLICSSPSPSGLTEQAVIGLKRRTYRHPAQ